MNHKLLIYAGIVLHRVVKREMARTAESLQGIRCEDVRTMHDRLHYLLNIRDRLPAEPCPLGIAGVLDQVLVAGSLRTMAMTDPIHLPFRKLKLCTSETVFPIRGTVLSCRRIPEDLTALVFS